jgi:GTP-binding protein HflX
LVFNKIDAYRKTYFDALLPEDEREHIEHELLQKAKATYGCEVVIVSAHTKENIELLKEKVYEEVKKNYAIKFPYLVNFY